MKRSRIFLGATTALLAVAGLAAAKKYGSASTRFYFTQSGYCAAAAGTFTFVPTLLANKSQAKLATISYDVAGSTKHAALYTQQLSISQTCATPLYYTKNN